MNRSYFLSVICILLLLWGTPIFAQGSSQDVSSINRVGTTAAQFLKIGAGPRAIAMGGAYTAVANDIYSVYWNPAGLSRIVGVGEAVFNHAEWLADTDYDFAAFSLNMGSVGAIGFSVISFRTPEEPVRTVANPEGTGQVWNANSFALGVTYARNLTDRFSIGATGKFVQESIFNLNARGGAFDLGVLFNTPLKGLTLGASISNFGNKLQLEGRDLFFNEDPLPDVGPVDEVPAEYRTESFEMPLNLKFGLAWTVRNETASIIATVDGSQPNDNEESFSAGVEMGLADAVFVRGGFKGYTLNESETGATFGVGINYNTVGADFKFDFGWADYGRLSNVQFVSLAIKY